MALTKSLKEIIAEDKTGLLAKHSSWERVLLSDVTRVLNGFPFESEKFNTNQGTPLIRIRDVLTGRSDTFYDGYFDPAFLVQFGEILVGMDGDFHVATWGNTPSLLNQRVCKLTVNESLYSKKLLQFLLPGYLSAIHAQTSSVTVKHLSSRSIQEIELPLPPYNEQTRIVAKLEELLSSLDAGTLELKAAQKKLVQYRQSLLKAAVEGTLTKAWRNATPASETGSALLARILKERRARWEAKQLAKFAAAGIAPPKDWQKKYAEPAKPDTTGLAKLPEGWVWSSIDQIGEVFLGKMLDKEKHQKGMKLPYLRNVNVRWGLIDIEDVSEMFFESHEIERYGLKVGDVLVCEGGEPGRAAICTELHTELKYQKALHRIRFFGLYEPQLVVSYLELLTKSGQLERSFTGTGIKHFTKESFVELPVPLPPLAEQHQLVESLKAAFAMLESQEATIAHSLKQSAAQRKNILQAAFAGRLVAQDPNDEPAGVLLARIAKERSKAIQAKTKVKVKIKA